MHSYKELKNWLMSDLGLISDLNQLTTHIQSFLHKTKKQSALDQNFTTIITKPLQKILAITSDTSLNQEEKISAANTILKKVFVDSFFREEHYLQRKEVLQNPTNYEAEIISRLKSPNPLGTLDVICILKNDPRNLSQTERAATLISAAAKIFIELNAEKNFSCDNISLNPRDHRFYFGRTVVPAEDGNTIHTAQKSTHITILINGNAYYLPIIDENNSIYSTDSIKNEIAAIIQNEHSNGAIGSLTSAPRKICYETRNKLANRGDNSALFNLIDESLFIVCLDQDTNPVDDQEKMIKKLFSNFSNRWYGTTQIAVGPNGVAGLIGSYVRGDNISTGMPLFDVIANVAFTVPISQQTTAKLANPRIKKLKFDLDHNDLRHLVEATQPYFHTQHSLFKLDAGVAYFLRRGLNPNAAIPLLIMLAARDIDTQKRLPIFKQALVVKDSESTGSALDWTFVPTHKIDKFVSETTKNNLTNQELFNLLKEAVADYANTIEKTSKGWSPTYCLQKPEGELYDELCQFFLTIGQRLEGGYAGYLFRPTRLPGSMDILISFHKLTPNITLLGRPGGTLEAVNKFGAHISFSRSNTEFSWMPNVNTDINLSELDAALRNWLSYIDKIST